MNFETSFVHEMIIHYTYDGEEFSIDNMDELEDEFKKHAAEHYRYSAQYDHAKQIEMDRAAEAQEAFAAGCANGMLADAGRVFRV